MTDQQTLPPPAAVTGPGVYSIPVELYHADPVPGGSLSSTGARKLLPLSCPARYKYWRENGEESTAAFDLGKVAHRLVLGAGEDFVEVEAADWRTKTAREVRDAARAEGMVPLLTADFVVAHEMAEALRAHPFAGKLFLPGSGEPEQTLIWLAQAASDVVARIEQRIVPCRALLDWLPSPRGGRLILPDYKTCASAAPTDVEKAIARYGYHIQLAWYLAGLRALGLAGDDATGLLVMQEKTPPYLVTVVQPNATAMRLADIRVRQALDIYAECMATGRWPGYADDVVIAELPPWETRELEGQVW